MKNSTQIELDEANEHIRDLETQHTQDGQIIADKIKEIAELGEKVRELKERNELE